MALVRLEVPIFNEPITGPVKTSETTPRLFTPGSARSRGRDSREDRDAISQTGGHFSSNLGTVELAVALHRVFESPKDKMIWDVGHQAYPHKLLTGRVDQFETIRQTDGLSGFLSILKASMTSSVRGTPVRPAVRPWADNCQRFAEAGRARHRDRR